MNWQALYLSPEGRTSQRDFWTAFLVLIAIWFVSLLLHIFAPIVWLLLVFPWVCVFAKRLHDFGKSAWLILIPVGIGFLAGMLALILGGVSVFSAALAVLDDGSDHEAWTSLFAGLGVMLACLGVAALVKFAFILWVGLSPGVPGPNRFGPPPAARAQPPSTAL